MLICLCQLFSCLDFTFDLVFKLGHIKHQLINFGCPHGKFLSFKIFSEDYLFSVDSFFSPLMRNISPASKVPCEIVSIYGVSTVGSNSFLFSSSLYVGFPEFKENSIIEKSPSHFSESLEGADILIFLFLNIKALLFLVINSCKEFTNIGFFLIYIDLIVVLVVNDILLLHELVLFKKLVLEIVEQSVINSFELSDMLLVISKRNLFSNYREMGAGCNT